MTKFALIAITLAGCLFQLGCKNNEPHGAHHQHELGDQSAGHEEGAHSVGTSCPVTGDPIDPRFTVNHGGRQVLFCCAGCVRMFKRNPAKYEAKITSSENE